MRIVLHAEGRSVRGNERQLLLIARGLLARGHELHASCHVRSEFGRALAAAGVQVSSARPRGDLDPLSALHFAAWLRRVRPDAVLLTSWKRLVTASAAARLARVPRVVMRMGGVHAPGNRLRAALLRHAFRRHLDAIYVNSQEVGAHLLRLVPQLDPQCIRRIPNAVVPQPAEPAQLHAQLGLAPDTPVILGVGGLERRKGFDLAIRALAQPPLAGVHLAIAGAGRSEQALREYMRGYGVAERVHLLGPRRDVPALLRAANVFVLPSRAEGMPVALLEAMASEIPAVAARTGGVGELLGARPGTGPAGWIVTVNDVAALANALANALEQPAEAQARAQEALRRVRTEYTVDVLVERVERLLAGSARDRAAVYPE